MSSNLFATGKNAFGECMRSGKKVPYSDLVQDGYIPGLLVCREWYEPPHPQDTPPPVTTDAEALANPSPEQSIPTGEGTAAPVMTFDALGKLSFV